MARTTSVMVDTVKLQASSRPWNERAQRAPRDERRRPSLVRLASTIGASFVLGTSAFLAGGPAPVAACCPAGATVLVSVTASPSTVDAGGSVTVAVHLTNPVADVLSVGICYSFPGGLFAPGCQGPQIGPDAIPLSLVSGTPRDGVWQGLVAVPTAAASGTWTVYSLTVFAGDGICACGSTSVLAGGNFNVIGGADTTPPTIFPPTISPTTVGSGGTVTISARITDDSGVAAAATQTLPNTASTECCVPMARVSGTPQDGIWQVNLVPSVPGDYVVTLVAAQDAAGNGGQIEGVPPSFFGTFTVSAKQDQSISFAPLANKIVGEPPFAVNATASSGLPVAFTASGPCSVSGSTVTLSSTGICTITAAQSGNDSFNAAPNVSQSFKVVSPPQFAQGVIDAMSGMGLPLGTSQSMTSMLLAFINSTTRGNQTAACGQLGALASYVNAQSGNQIPSVDAALLLVDVARLTTASGC